MMHLNGNLETCFSLSFLHCEIQHLLVVFGTISNSFMYTNVLEISAVLVLVQDFKARP